MLCSCWSRIAYNQRKLRFQLLQLQGCYMRSLLFFREYHMLFYGESDRSKIESLADLFELDLHKKITDLSFGNKKKCAILQSVLHDPDLLILDEPTSGLDPLM